MSDSDEIRRNEPGGGTSASAVAGAADSADTSSNVVPEKSFENMRSSARKNYPFHQRIAPMHGGLLPSTDEYFNVECKDISQGGISFYLKRPPGCEEFAIMLGQRPMVTILVAKVVYYREVHHNGKLMHLVGCQFTDRLQQ